MTKAREGALSLTCQCCRSDGNVGQANYHSLKSWLNWFPKSVLCQCWRNVRVNVIAPGFIESVMTDEAAHS